MLIIGLDRRAAASRSPANPRHDCKQTFPPKRINCLRVLPSISWIMWVSGSLVTGAAAAGPDGARAAARTVLRWADILSWHSWHFAMHSASSGGGAAGEAQQGRYRPWMFMHSTSRQLSVVMSISNARQFKCLYCRQTSLKMSFTFFIHYYV